MTTRSTGSTEPAGQGLHGQGLPARGSLAQGGTLPGRAGAGRGALSVRRALVHLGVVLAVVALGGAALGGAPMAQSAVLGVVLGAVNLLAMRYITRAMTEGGSAAWALALPVKLVALVGVAYLLVQSGVALAIPLAVGFAVLPLTSVFLPQPSTVRGRA